MNRKSAGKEVPGKITIRKIRGHLKTITEHKILVMKHCFRIGLYRQGLLHDLSKYMPSELLMGFRYYEDGKSSPNNGERRDRGYSGAWLHHKGRNRHHFEYWLDYRLPSAQERKPDGQGREACGAQGEGARDSGASTGIIQNSGGQSKEACGAQGGGARDSGASTGIIQNSGGQSKEACAAQGGGARCFDSSTGRIQDSDMRSREDERLGAPYPLQAAQMPRRYVAEMLMDRISASKNYNKENYTQHDPLAYFDRGKGHYLMHPQTRRELRGMLRILDERGEEELFRFVKDYYLKGYPIPSKK